MRSDQLLVDIERCRGEMVELANALTYSNKKVVDVSTKLDKLLNKYHTLNGKNKQ
ncbi:Spo0E family sporulation regulatory protein-aspartic acid phosphatase [Bacillus sp. CGMCC 1.16607]|uniref:Spo0E family sporulation regulatory protein-aspartic acid phosphatase n=1 Tax=Bacillus sp. CGMCC 1.16607 TaxID=3351842 RepID=UPI003631BB39